MGRHNRKRKTRCLGQERKERLDEEGLEERQGGDRREKEKEEESRKKILLLLQQQQQHNDTQRAKEIQQQDAK